MPDPALHGNGRTCLSCELRREVVNTEIGSKVDVPCNRCGETGRLPVLTKQIIANHVAEARERFWPERERAWARLNA